MKFVVLCFLLVGCAVLVWIGFYQKNKLEHPVAEVRASDSSRSIYIPKESYDKAKWDKYGPGFEDLKNNTQLWMSKTGSITYDVRVGQTLLTGDTVEVTAKMSSELNKTTSSDIAFSSDVTLFVNGIEQSTLNVIPDNVVGQDYTWKVSSSAFKPNEVNPITFAVKKEAFYKNGIVFYSPIQLKFQ